MDVICTYLLLLWLAVLFGCFGYHAVLCALDQEYGRGALFILLMGLSAAAFFTCPIFPWAS